MQALNQFSLPVLGLKIGQHEFKFNLDKAYFEAFETSPYKNGSLVTQLNLNKKHDHLVLDFQIEGHLRLECNRCSDMIDYPVFTENQVLVKYDENEREEEEIIYIHPESSIFNCSKIFYETILLSLPLSKTCDEADNKECNPQVLKYLEQEEESEESETALSNALKNLKLN